MKIINQGKPIKCEAFFYPLNDSFIICTPDKKMFYADKSSLKEVINLKQSMPIRRFYSDLFEKSFFEAVTTQTKTEITLSEEDEVVIQKEDDFIPDLKKGTRVIAIRHVDTEGANVRPGTKGTVFELKNAHGDGGGPMVVWENNGCCNVYKGDFAIIKDE